MSNDSLIERVLIACESYETGEISMENLISSVELNIAALEGLSESQRHLRNLATSLELAQFECGGEDRIRKANSLVTQLKDALQSIRRVGSAP